MILFDANILIYARTESAPQHTAAREWLDATLSRGDRVGFPWESLLAFMRILSHPRVVERPEPIADLWQQAQEWLSASGAWIPTPTERHRDCFTRMLPHAAHANHLPDADLAALALEYGLIVHSTDGDFARFPDIRWMNPIA